MLISGLKGLIAVYLSKINSSPTHTHTPHKTKLVLYSSFPWKFVFFFFFFSFEPVSVVSFFRYLVGIVASNGALTSEASLKVICNVC